MKIQFPVDTVIDTDAYNEIDDQFAISYLLSHGESLRTVALYAAPFFNSIQPLRLTVWKRAIMNFHTF